MIHGVSGPQENLQFGVHLEKTGSWKSSRLQCVSISNPGKGKEASGPKVYSGGFSLLLTEWASR